MNAEDEARKQLAELGIEPVTFTGELEVEGGKLLTYVMEDGEPVMDAPGVLVDGDDVTLMSWSDALALVDDDPAEKVELTAAQEHLLALVDDD